MPNTSDSPRLTPEEIEKAADWLFGPREFDVEAARLFANQYCPDPTKRRIHAACDEIERLRRQVQDGVKMMAAAVWSEGGELVVTKAAKTKPLVLHREDQFGTEATRFTVTD